ncbi:MAG TPA: phosphoribosyltransferase family protein [Polyangiales bacterium]|nr:phosphoribosyltransferase family protein [Polyangiales bacterium]
MSQVIIVGNVSEDPFAIDVAHSFDQVADLSDIISLKNFANGEFCPRFISDETDTDSIGDKLHGATVVIVSVDNPTYGRQTLAQRNFLLARAAKDNGAVRVVLVEPDLFYSAQDRGPRVEHGETVLPREVKDLKKFDGQPFSSLLYAQLLKTAGVDAVITVHNHSHSVQDLFRRVFGGDFANLGPAELYAHYLRNSDIVAHGDDGSNLVLCAPDRGAVEFVDTMHTALGFKDAGICRMTKERAGERQVEIQVATDSPVPLSGLAGKDVVIFDDMVRTGSTIVNACHALRNGRPRRVLFCVSHFYSSEEGRQNLAASAIDEILTLNTLPSILNRDMQGRLRRKLVVLKIEKWIARHLRASIGAPLGRLANDFYAADMSSKNPRCVTPPRA